MLLKNKQNISHQILYSAALNTKILWDRYILNITLRIHQTQATKYFTLLPAVKLNTNLLSDETQQGHNDKPHKQVKGERAVFWDPDVANIASHCNACSVDFITDYPDWYSWNRWSDNCPIFPISFWQSTTSITHSSSTWRHSLPLKSLILPTQH